MWGELTLHPALVGVSSRRQTCHPTRTYAEHHIKCKHGCVHMLTHKCLLPMSLKKIQAERESEREQLFLNFVNSAAAIG